MLRYSAIRILLLIPIIICVTFIIYWLVDLAPGTVVDTMINEDMSPEDIAELALFLCSGKAGFLTGENICVDGGMTRQMIYHGEHGWEYRA